MLEAGGEPVPQSQVPYFTPQVSSDPGTNYIFESIPQANAGKANGGVWFYDKNKIY
jgi:hypothetical protein